mmetsp:Transcript_96303/g.171087  ORF Transcript_96303/g.171087 Transcript_96303/m.171087 type:complete len:108 (+) Transcript_96303:985-1308(+)
MQGWCFTSEFGLSQLSKDLTSTLVTSPGPLYSACALLPPDHEACVVDCGIVRRTPAKWAVTLPGKLFEASQTFTVEHVTAAQDHLWSFAKVVQANAAGNVTVLPGVR